MENHQQSRACQVAAAGALFLIALFNSPPSTPSIPADRPEPPTDVEIEALTELSEWVLGGSSSPSFKAFKDRTLTVAETEPPFGFELFRRYHGAESGRELVEELPFGRLIRDASARHGVDPLLVAAMVEAESGFDPNAVSAVGAVGLMQVLPTTAELYSDGDPFDPVVNMGVGTRYLRSLLKQFDGDTALALAAYNAGPGNVLRHQGVPPFRETRNYVERVMSRYVDYHQVIWQNSPDGEWFL